MADEDEDHYFGLTPIDQIMPRGYTRMAFCFPYLSNDPSPAIQALQEAYKVAISRFPFMAGTVSLERDGGEHNGRLEVRYNARDIKEAHVFIKTLSAPEFPYTYEQLQSMGMPPSKLPGSLISPLPEFPDATKASPVMALQANFIPGGLILSVYTHRNVTDAAGTGVFMFALRESLITHGEVPLNLPDFADEKLRLLLTPGLPPQSPLHEHPEYTLPLDTDRIAVCTPESPGDSSGGKLGNFGDEETQHLSEGKIFVLSHERVQALETYLNAHVSGADAADNSDCKSHKPMFISTDDTLCAVIWVFVTRARAPHLSNPEGNSVDNELPTSFNLSVSIRGHVEPPLPAFYIGASVVYSQAILPVKALLRTGGEDIPADQSIPFKPGSGPTLAQCAVEIRRAIDKVMPSHVRSLISLCHSTPDIRDLTVNAHFSGGPDIIVTNWRDLNLSDGQFIIPGLGNEGKVEYIRKPWSRQDGAMILLPRRNQTTASDLEDADDLEILIQLRCEDMARLKQDEEFMSYVKRVIE